MGFMHLTLFLPKRHLNIGGRYWDEKERDKRTDDGLKEPQ